ncbi:MAG: ABC transporter substrate-binding protein [Solirubrobacterales bacterium]
MRSRLTALIAVIAFAAVTVAAGCGSSNNDNGSTNGGTLTAASFSVQTDPAIAGQVPADVKSNGSLSVAADATYAPDEFIASDGKTVIGMDADLAKAIAQLMGLQANVQNIPFESIIPGLDAGKYDLGMSSFTDTKDREKTVDFVTYATAGTSFFVQASGGPNIATLDDLCGHKVGAERGTTQADDATAQDKKCTDAGKPAVSVSVFPDENGVNLALSSGRIDVAMADTPPAEYAVKQSDGKFKISGSSYGNAPYGIAMSKDSGLQQPVLAAVKALMADGTYKKILDYWGVSADAISNPTINGATS